jgi:DUF971 family protein
VVHQKSRVLEIEFEGAGVHRLSFEFLRVFSPSAEVRGHGPGQETLQVGKRDVGIEALEPVGNYAIQPRFSDGHATGIYSWDYLYELASNQQSLWQDYLQRLQAAGQSREPQPAAGSGGAGQAAAGQPVAGQGAARQGAAGQVAAGQGAGAKPASRPSGSEFQAIPLTRRKQAP